jgi:predicted N-acyltransferase
VDYQVTLSNTEPNLSDPAWIPILNRYPFHSPAWHRFHPASWYALIQNGTAPVGLASFYLARDIGMTLSSRLAQRLMTWFLARRPLLLCTSPTGNVSGCLLEPDAAMLKSLQPAMHELAARSGASFIVFGYCSDPLADALHTALPGFSKMSLDDGMNLAIRWSSFDDYLASLSSHARQNYRNHGNRARDLGMRLVPVEHWQNELPRLRVLAENVALKHNSTPDEGRRLLNWAATVPPELSHMVFVYCGDNLAGFSLRLRDGDHLFLFSLGLDYQYHFVYFQIFYDAIRFAIENGIKVLHGGSAAYDIKQRLGFEPVHSTAVFRPTSALLGLLMRKLAGFS